MIVVDTNVVAHLHLPGDRTPAAEAAWRRDPGWHAPLLWRSEFRNVLALHVRERGMRQRTAERIVEQAEGTMETREHLVRSTRVLRLAERSERSAYDCEFVALAEALGVQLVTADRDLAESFPGRARTLESFAS